jgi:molybdopterin converting factor small subunit
VNRINIPLMLQQIAGNQAIVEVEGTTIRECKDNLIKRFPGFQEWLNEHNPMAWITVNQKLISLTEIDQEVSESDELDIILLLAGG